MSAAVVIYSGGLDSTVLLHKAVREYTTVHALSFHYGQKHSVKELECARENARRLQTPHSIIDLSFFSQLTRGSSALTDTSIDIPHISEVLGDPQPVTYVPNRNMMLISIAAAFAETHKASKIVYGAQAHDTFSGYWDATKEFLDSINQVLSLNRRNDIQIEAPLLTLKKPEIIKLGIALNVDFNITWTCYNGRARACGTCPTCADRIKAFMDCDLKDPIEYETSIPWSTK